MLKIIIFSIIIFIIFLVSGWFFRIVMLVALFFILRRFIFRFDKIDGSQFWVFFGLPGSGKTTILAEICRQCILRHMRCMSNVPITGVEKVERGDLGKFQIENCVLLFDEASIDYFKRDFKAFTKEENTFHSLHRHYNVHEIFFAQTWDGMDLRLRELNTKLFFVTKLPFGIIRIQRIAKAFKIDEDGQPMDGYEFVPFSSKFVFARKAWKLFDTLDAPKLPPKKFPVFGAEPQKIIKRTDSENTK